MLVAMPLDLQPDLLAGCSTNRAATAASVGDDLEGRLAHCLAEIERALDSAPARARESPIRRAIWRALLLPAGFVLWAFRQQLDADRLGGKPAEDPDALQAMAYVLVARAALGDVRAASMIFDMIEGRPSVRHGDTRSRQHRPLNQPVELAPEERARMIAELEAALGKASTGQPSPRR
jgi:hypothetical protein